MILAHWRGRRANRNFIDQFHGRIVAAARRPELYAELRVPDTFDGRFEMVTLHAWLVMRPLLRRQGAAAELAHEVIDSVFRHFDVALREIGYGDVAVAKRLKKMAEAFYGRSKAYDESLGDANPDRLAGALARNVYCAAEPALAPLAPRLAAWVRAAAAALEATPPEAFAAGAFAFPPLDDVAAHAEAGRG
jgi:cytochrome b pre-mRNA-processing protein 3